MGTRILALALALVALGGGATAEAKDNGGHFGIGVDSALGWAAPVGDDVYYSGVGLPGISLDYQISSGLQLQALVGVSMGMGIDDGPDRRDTFWQLGLRAIPTIQLHESVNLGIPVGFAMLGSRTKPDGADAAHTRYFTIEAGLRPEWFVHERLSLFTAIGVVLAITDKDFAGPDERVIGVDFFGNAGLLANAGFHFWF